jgi:hypothetical protein
MDSSIIIILAIALILLIALNHITIMPAPIPPYANCSQTMFGCCPDGVNSKINFFGTNCQGYRPQPTPEPIPGPGPRPPKSIGGCAGTRYGCCQNNFTPKVDTQGSNC